MSTKKRGGKGLKDDSILSGAIKDLEREIGNSMKLKSELKNSLDGISDKLEEDRVLERKLQQKIAKLVSKEARLNEKKKLLQAKIDGISDKIGKVEKIKTEMKDV